MPSYRQHWKASVYTNYHSTVQKAFDLIPRKALKLKSLKFHAFMPGVSPACHCRNSDAFTNRKQWSHHSGGWNKALDRFGLHWFRYQHTRSHISMCSKRQYTNIFLLITGSSWTCVPSSSHNPRFDSILEYSSSNVAFENVLPGVYVCFILPT